MNGPRTNQFVAPTSFITSISRRREKIERRIVFAIRSVEARISRIAAATKNVSITCVTCSTCFVSFPPQSIRCTPGRPASWSSFPIVGLRSPLFG